MQIFIISNGTHTKYYSNTTRSSHVKEAGTLEAGGYIWHTTGSGKTLTSFKTAQVASALPYIDKVLFVVDRKDLDYQTMKEYDRFQKGAANSNTSTRIFQKQLEDNTSHIIITTIQKLDVFVSKNNGHEVFKKHVVIIFDECHRSQFGDMHSKIVKSFKQYHLFGFTGTPIFAANAGSGGNPLLRTTSQAFGGEPDINGKKVLPLHTYTIVDAINDQNVLPFRIDYINTVKMKNDVKDKNVSAIDTEKAMADPVRIREVVGYILEHFDQKTKRNNFYSLQGQRVSGFNSILAVSSIPVAKKYYTELKKQLAECGRKL
ncbi:MAG: DEAD/DEAH box helicase family protein, partial [Erysipelotrichaceae bacterium]|nr:DEAD/DEAH box helicase family protein [Erysipelotrichaceae bacterium]